MVAAVVAALFGKRASTEAAKARKVVLSNSLAEEINLAQKIAVEIATLIDLEKHELARLYTQDLHDRTLTIMARWDSSLSLDSKNNLLNAKLQLESLRAVSSKIKTGILPNPRQHSLMQDRCGKIRDIFVEEHASAMRRTDEVKNA